MIFSLGFLYFLDFAMVFMVHVISSEFGMVKRSTIMAFSYNETKETYFARHGIVTCPELSNGVLI